MNPEPARRYWWPAGIVVLGLAALFFLNPTDHGVFPQCIFHQLTGWNCPACGATRAGYALLHGRWTEAWRDNALLVLALPVSGALALRFVARGRQGPVLPKGILWLGLAGVVVFTVVRNLPMGAMFSP